MAFKVKAEVYSRVSGYFRPVDRWNRGKQEEFSMRKKLKYIPVMSSAPEESEAELLVR